MSIKTKLQDRMKVAMKAGEKDTLLFSRNAIAAIRKKEIDDRVDLDDAGIMKILSGQIKQRKDSIDQYKQGGRADLVAAEEAELKFLEGYLPAAMPESELKAIVESVIAELKPTGPKEMGKVMQAVLAKAAGRADGKMVSQLVSQSLKAISV